MHQEKTTNIPKQFSGSDFSDAHPHSELSLKLPWLYANFHRWLFPWWSISKTMSGEVFMTENNHSFSCWGMLTNMTGLYTWVEVGYLQQVPNMLHTSIYFKSFVWSSELAKGQFIWYSELAKHYPLTPRSLAAVKALQFSIQKDEHSLSLRFGSTSFPRESLVGASELPPARAVSLQILKSVCKRKETELFLIFIYSA